MTTPPTPPTQTISYALGRGLLVWETWESVAGRPLGIQKAAIFDFASNYPRAFSDVVDGMRATLRAHGVFEPDVSDLFAARHFHTLRTQATVVVNSLVARGLLEPGEPNDAEPEYVLTAEGRAVSRSLAGRHARATRAILETLSTAWKSSSAETLRGLVASSLPNQTVDIADFVAAATKRTEAS